MCAKGYELSLLLFSDVLEIAKRRSCASKGLGLKSPSTMSLRSVGLAGGGVSLPQGNLHDTLRPGDTSSIGGGGAGMPGMPGSKVLLLHTLPCCMKNSVIFFFSSANETHFHDEPVGDQKSRGHCRRGSHRSICSGLSDKSGNR